jgi:DNA-binding IclR family transcriptional regulator
VDRKKKTRGAGTGVYTVPAVKKAVMILEMMALDNRGYSISEVARRCNLPVSTANVLLYTLQECGYVQRSDNRAFSLTWRLFTEGSKLLNQAQLHEVALPELERLAELTDLTIDFAIPDRYELIYVYVIQGRGDIQIQARVGQRRCFHQSAAGKAMLAFFPEERTKEIAKGAGLPAATARTITTYKSLLKELGQIRLQGYAIDNEESGRGLWGAAAPVLDYTGNAVAALGVAGTTLAPDGNTQALIQEIKKSARNVSRHFGFEAGDVRAVSRTFQGTLQAGLRGVRAR